jgi:signal peptidase II
MKECRSRWWYVVVILGAAFLDRITKYWALSYLSTPKDIVPFLRLELVFNRGVSWGLLYSDNTFGFILVTGLIIVVIATLAMYTFNQFIQRDCVGPEVLVLTGALCNIYDRFAYGGVVDFIVLHIGSWQWPVFNVADVCIVLGVGVMLWRTIISK